MGPVATFGSSIRACISPNEELPCFPPTFLGGVPLWPRRTGAGEAWDKALIPGTSGKVSPIGGKVHHTPNTETPNRMNQVVEDVFVLDDNITECHVRGIRARRWSELSNPKPEDEANHWCTEQGHQPANRTQHSGKGQELHFSAMQLSNISGRLHCVSETLPRSLRHQ